MGDAWRIFVVVIGRNEGERLIRGLDALRAHTADPVSKVIYVDSGSTDGSVQAARARGAAIVDLDMRMPFTAARARNAGIDWIRQNAEPAGSEIFVQFVDGDCELQPGWLTMAAEFLAQNPGVAALEGRLRERHPERSIYNRLCDDEWARPAGETAALGGIAMMRWAALQEVGGFDPTLIAGEEPEICLRMRQKGWKIWRLEAEMALHDAAMTRFSQFWTRMRRGGFAAAQSVAMNGREAAHGVATLRRAALWAALIPALILSAAAIAGPEMLWLALVYPAQIARLAIGRGGDGFAWERATFLTLGKFAEAQGALGYLWRTYRGGPVRLIEYK